MPAWPFVINCLTFKTRILGEWPLLPRSGRSVIVALKSVAECSPIIAKEALLRSGLRSSRTAELSKREALPPLQRPKLDISKFRAAGPFYSLFNFRQRLAGSCIH